MIAVGGSTGDTLLGRIGRALSPRAETAGAGTIEPSEGGVVLQTFKQMIGRFRSSKVTQPLATDTLNKTPTVPLTERNPISLLMKADGTYYNDGLQRPLTTRQATNGYFGNKLDPSFAVDWNAFYYNDHNLDDPFSTYIRQPMLKALTSESLTPEQRYTYTVGALNQCAESLRMGELNLTGDKTHRNGAPQKLAKLLADIIHTTATHEGEGPVAQKTKDLARIAFNNNQQLLKETLGDPTVATLESKIFPKHLLSRAAEQVAEATLNQAAEKQGLIADSAQRLQKAKEDIASLNRFQQTGKALTFYSGTHDEGVLNARKAALRERNEALIAAREPKPPITE